MGELGEFSYCCFNYITVTAFQSLQVTSWALYSSANWTPPALTGRCPTYSAGHVVTVLMYCRRCSESVRRGHHLMPTWSNTYDNKSPKTKTSPPSQDERKRVWQLLYFFTKNFLFTFRNPVWNVDIYRGCVPGWHGFHYQNDGIWRARIVWWNHPGQSRIQIWASADGLDKGSLLHGLKTKTQRD